MEEDGGNAKEGNKTKVVILIIRKKNMANFISHTAAELREREKTKKKSTIWNIISYNSLRGVRGSLLYVDESFN